MKEMQTKVENEIEAATEFTEDYAGKIITPPTVFLAGDTYQIVFETDITGIARVRIGDMLYTDNTNGVVRSEDTFHKVTIPCNVLDDAGEYTVEFAHIADRIPYSPKSGQFLYEKRKFFAPGKKDSIKVYMLADTHTRVEAPTRTGTYFGDDIDLLILAGDIGNTAKHVDVIRTIHRLAENIVHGEKPCIFVRGNHDTRGKVAEMLPSVVGNVAGNTFFTFRAGNIWGVALDCGEDKEDSHFEYGDIADYVRFRQAQTEFLKKIIADKKNEYEAEGVKHKIAVCHIPFTTLRHDFVGSDEIYNEWTELLNEMNIDLMLTGHRHRIIYFDADAHIHDAKTVAKFPVLVGSRMSDDPESMRETNDNEFTGSALEFFNTKEINLKFTNSVREVIREVKVK